MADTTRQSGDFRILLELAVPVVLSELGWMVMGIVDTIMVGRLGSVSIGAVGVGSAVYYVPSLFGIGLLLGLDTFVSQAYGRKDYDECHRWLAQGVYIALAYAPVSMLMVWGLTFSLGKFGINSAVASSAQQYLAWINLGTLPLLVYAAFRRYLQGIGRVKPIMFALLSANLVNWAGNWIFIYGHWGAPALGVRGSALSTMAARVYMAAVVGFVAWRHEARRGHPLFAHWPGPELRRIGQLLLLGLPAAGQIVMEVGAFGAATLVAGRLSPDALAAHQVVLNCASFTYMVPLGISAAAAVVVGHAVGEGNRPRARRRGWLAIATGAGFMTLAAAAFLLIPAPILRIYSVNRSVLAVGVPLLGLAGVFQIFDGIQGVSAGTLRGWGDTRTSMYANLFGYWVVGLPLGYALCFVAGWGVFGIWAGLTVALILIAAIVLWRWRQLSSSAGAQTLGT